MPSILLSAVKRQISLAIFSLRTHINWFHLEAHFFSVFFGIRSLVCADIWVRIYAYCTLLLLLSCNFFLCDIFNVLMQKNNYLMAILLFMLRSDRNDLKWCVFLRKAPHYRTHSSLSLPRSYIVTSRYNVRFRLT